MDRHEYMTTGEFASAMGVSKDTLFHYDDIGLFCPERYRETGIDIIPFIRWRHLIPYGCCGTWGCL